MDLLKRFSSFLGVCRKSAKKFYNKLRTDSSMQMDLVRMMLVAKGEDPDRPGLKDTPGRIVRMWKERYRGNFEKPPILTIFENGKDGIQYDQMIIDKGYFYSECEHHGLPFFGGYCFAYIPDKNILGLSKVARIVEYFSAKMQIQERLTKEIVDYIEAELQPAGIALVMEARHLCKEMRGVKQHDCEMITNEVRGAFKTNPAARAEFLNFVNGKK